MFNPDEAQYANSILCQLPYPTDDTRLIIEAAQRCIAQLYRLGFAYAKAETLLLDLCQRKQYTTDLFAPEQPVRTDRLMSVLDLINHKWGRGTFHPARLKTNPEWGMRHEMLSPSYTTNLRQLWSVAAR